MSCDRNIELGTTIFSQDKKEVKIVTLKSSSSKIKAYLDTGNGNEVALDSINVASIIEILFSSLDEMQKENLIIMLEKLK